MPEKIPVLVVGDAPNVTGGLSRIARDITALLYQDSDVLGIEAMQAGILYDGSPWPWRVFPLHDEPNWGRGDFERVYALKSNFSGTFRNSFNLVIRKLRDGSSFFSVVAV